LKVSCSCPARAAFRFAGKGTKLAELPIPANHRFGAGLGGHGRLRPSLEEDVAGAQAVMNALPLLGISIDAVTGKLVEDGVRLFAEAADRLYAAVQKKRQTPHESP
jgi:hypothetical protein